MTTIRIHNKRFAALLGLFLLGVGATKAYAAPTDKTNWKDQLADVSVGLTSASPTDVEVSIAATADTTYKVKTAKGLAWIARITNSKDSVYKADGKGYLPLYPHQQGFKNCTVKLGDNDINLTDHYWTPIGKTSSTPFNGTFDGNYKVVKKLKIDIEDTNIASYIYAGLFGYLQGDVHDLGIQVDEAGIKGKSQFVYAGALAGYNKGVIQNCFAIGESNAVIDAESISSESLGGLIGDNSGGSITNCYATLNIKGTVLNNYTFAYAGGLVGYNEGNISHVYATGKVETTGQGTSNMGGVAGYISNCTLSHALAANPEGITATNINTNNFLGRVCGKVFTSDAHCDTATCYASTKIRMNGKVTGVGENSSAKHFDGINADTDTDLSELFPTGDDAVWEYSNGNLPILKDFSSGSQGTTEKTAVFDSPLNLEELTANNTQTYIADSLIFSNTEGWIHKHGTAGQRNAFSGRVKGTGTNVQLAIKTDTAAVLSFKDRTELTGPSNTNPKAIIIDKSQTEGKTTDVTLRSEGTVTVKGSGDYQYVLSLESGVCHVDPKNRFLLYGDIHKNSGELYGMISWKWPSESAPKSDITVNWDGGSVVIPCDDNNAYKLFATNPGGNNITVRVGKDYQKGFFGTSEVSVSTFYFADPETRVYTSYSGMQSAADKGTADNPYIIDLAALSTDATADGYTYTDANNRKIVTLNYTGNNDSVYYSIENQAATNAHILLTSNAVSTPLCLKARSGCIVDSLQVPASANWTLKGDTLKASYVEVSGGLKLDGPVTVENTANETYNYALKVLAGGSVTVNDVLKAYVTGTGSTAINVENKGSFTIGEKGKVYAYGTIFDSSDKLSISDGGILRCAGSIGGFGVSAPVIEWRFTNKPKTELVAKHGSEEIRFTREMFGKYLDETGTFTAKVAEGVNYELYQVTGDEDVKLIGTTSRGDIVNAFSATAGQITSYQMVGKPIPQIVDEKSITFTTDGEYTDSKGSTHEFNGILDDTKAPLLQIKTGETVEMAINNVNVDSLVVKQGTTILYLNGENTLDSIAVAEGGELSFKGANNISTLTCSKGVVNRGTFYDYTGLIRSVTIPLASGEVDFSLDIPAEVKVARGGQTELKPSGKIPEGAAYYWYEWKDNRWDWLNGGYDYEKLSYTLGVGKYMCYVKVTLSGVTLKSTGSTVTTTLTSFFTVTEKSTPPYIPPPSVTVPTSNAEVAPDAAGVWLADGQLHIRTPQAADMHIYTFGGNLLHSARIPAGDTTIQAPDSPCIVLIGKQRFKFAPR
ncbi:GLUG motif-containing protein [Parabacteroides bouchesdurhonensis]|uniref:GLUG motif-containing protein n=1 Tax=Parabacteroides bouchesdurhonensis TaxID=1936995 RepID=UPI0011C43BF6|nr:GLUG motif-containing protein [Parabacteroides bouchesdurhonensis]